MEWSRGDKLPGRCLDGNVTELASTRPLYILAVEYIGRKSVEVVEGAHSNVHTENVASSLSTASLFPPKLEATGCKNSKGVENSKLPLSPSQSFSGQKLFSLAEPEIKDSKFKYQILTCMYYILYYIIYIIYYYIILLYWLYSLPFYGVWESSTESVQTNHSKSPRNPQVICPAT